MRRIIVILVILAAFVAVTVVIVGVGLAPSGETAAAPTYVEVEQIIYEEATSAGISPAWLLRVALCETGGTLSPWRIGAAGEIGIAQWHPSGVWWSTPAGRQGVGRPYGDVRLDVAMMAWAFAHGYASHWSCQ